jgi:hypothetical protein
MRRNHTEQLVDLLYNIRTYPKLPFSRILSITGINKGTSFELKYALITKGFIIYDDKTLSLTAKAGDWLKQFEAVNLEVKPILSFVSHYEKPKEKK